VSATPTLRRRFPLPRLAGAAAQVLAEVVAGNGCWSAFAPAVGKTTLSAPIGCTPLA
jgi:hypothetical protein